MLASFGYERTNVPNYDVVVDARNFPDPHKAGWGHTGHHPAIIARLCNHRNFNVWLQIVKRMINDAYNPLAHNTPLKVAMACNKGRHRSVAATLILQHILRHDGWIVVEVRHLSSNTWGRRGICNGGRGECRECKDPEPELRRMKTNALAVALDAWRNA